MEKSPDHQKQKPKKDWKEIKYTPSISSKELMDDDTREKLEWQWIKLLNHSGWLKMKIADETKISINWKRMDINELTLKKWMKIDYSHKESNENWLSIKLVKYNWDNTNTEYFTLIDPEIEWKTEKINKDIKETSKKLDELNKEYKTLVDWFIDEMKRLSYSWMWSVSWDLDGLKIELPIIKFHKRLEEPWTHSKIDLSTWKIDLPSWQKDSTKMLIALNKGKIFQKVEWIFNKGNELKPLVWKKDTLLQDKDKLQKKLYLNALS